MPLLNPRNTVGEKIGFKRRAVFKADFAGNREYVENHNAVFYQNRSSPQPPVKQGGYE